MSRFCGYNIAQILCPSIMKGRLRTLRVRPEPGKDKAINGGLVTGEDVNVLGANPDRTWLKVRIAKDITGWACTDLIILTAPLKELLIVDS
jgi:hypothetical protein